MKVFYWDTNNSLRSAIYHADGRREVRYEGGGQYDVERLLANGYVEISLRTAQVLTLPW